MVRILNSCVPAVCENKNYENLNARIFFFWSDSYYMKICTNENFLLYGNYYELVCTSQSPKESIRIFSPLRLPSISHGIMECCLDKKQRRGCERWI